MTEVDVPLRKCRKPDCFRQVRDWIEYCCYPCEEAATGWWELEPRGHTAGCHIRNAERGEEPRP